MLIKVIRTQNQPIGHVLLYAYADINDDCYVKCILPVLSLALDVLIPQILLCPMIENMMMTLFFLIP